MFNLNNSFLFNFSFCVQKFCGRRSHRSCGLTKMTLRNCRAKFSDLTTAAAIQAYLREVWWNEQIINEDTGNKRRKVVTEVTSFIDVKKNVFLLSFFCWQSKIDDKVTFQRGIIELYIFRPQEEICNIGSIKRCIWRNSRRYSNIGKNIFWNSTNCADAKSKRTINIDVRGFQFNELIKCFKIRDWIIKITRKSFKVLKIKN